MSGCAECRQLPEWFQEKEQLLRLLNEALGLVDSLALPLEIGARLQEVIDLAGACGAEQHAAG